MRTMGAAKFKAQCLAVMDEVEQKGEPVVVTKNGRPVARLVPVESESREAFLGRYRFPCKVLYSGDVVSPVAELEDWDALG